MAKADKRSKAEADYDSARAKRVKLSKSNREAAQMGDVSDSEEDLGHSMSVKFLAATKVSAKRSHSAVSNQRNIIEERKKNLANSLEEKALSITNRDHQLKEALIKVVIDARQDSTVVGEKGFNQSFASEPTASAIYQSAKLRIASSRELLGHYERASQQVAYWKGVPMMVSGWRKDSQTLQRILSRRGEKTKLELHQLLNEDSILSKEQVKCDISKLDNDLWKRFAVGEARDGSVEPLGGRKEKTWAVIAKNAQRGVRRTVKNLPEDGE